MDGVFPTPDAGLQLSNSQLNTLVNHAPTSQLSVVLGRPFKGIISSISEKRTGPVYISGSIKCRSLLDTNGLRKKRTRRSRGQRVRSDAALVKRRAEVIANFRLMPAIDKVWATELTRERYADHGCRRSRRDLAWPRRDAEGDEPWPGSAGQTQAETR
jgi:hypothetical protein